MLTLGCASGMLPVNFRTTCLLWHAHVHFDWGPTFFRLYLLLWHVLVSFEPSSAKRPFWGSLHRDLVKTPLMGMMEILPKTSSRDLCGESFYRDLAQRSCRRPLLQILYRDVVNSKDLAQRFCVKILARDLTLRCLTEIFCQDLFKTPCTDSLPQGSCTATLFRELE